MLQQETVFFGLVGTSFAFNVIVVVSGAGVVSQGVKPRSIIGAFFIRSGDLYLHVPKTSQAIELLTSRDTAKILLRSAYYRVHRKATVSPCADTHSNTHRRPF